jgi:hypothetical protein
MLICMAVCRDNRPRLTAAGSSQGFLKAAEEHIRSFHPNTVHRFIPPFFERLLFAI